MKFTKQAFVIAFLDLLGKVFPGKKFIYYSPGGSNVLGKTAVKSVLGFWYAGNVLDKADIANGILNNGVVEKEGTELVQKLLPELAKGKPQTIFYDIGANTGYYGILAAFLGQGKTRVYAFEPVAEFNAVENQTILLNRMENYCRVFSLALGKDNSEVEIFVSGSGTTLYKDFMGKMLEEVRKVKKFRLDDFTRQENIPDPDMVKIDVEAAEYEVLQGAAQLLQRALPVLWFECAKTVENLKYNNPHYQATMDLLKSWGYAIYRQDGDRLIAVSAVLPPDDTQMYLALHKNKHAGLLTLLNLKLE